MELEKIARQYVQGLKDLYVNISVYAVVSGISLLVWLCLGGGGFWPIWVFLAFGLATVLQGWAIGSIKKLEEILPFLKPEWEEQQLKKLLKQPVSTKIHPAPEKTEIKAEQSESAKEGKVVSKKPTDSKPTSAAVLEKKASQSAKSTKTTSKKAPVKKKPVA